MVNFVIVLCAIVGLALAEKPAPYPAKGWKPQGARLELPRQYGTPRAAPEEIDFTTLSNEYLPATTEIPNQDDDNLRVQGLPGVEATSQFKKFQRKQPTNVRARPQLGRIQMAPAPAFSAQPFLLTSVFAPQFAPASQRLQDRQFGRQVEQVDDVQQVPARGYGTPATNNDVPVPEERDAEPIVPQNDEPEQPQHDSDYDEDREQDESDVPTIAVSNSETTGNLVEATEQGQAGQYYILLPDNSLQKVRFATKQTAEDRQINGFSAQLR